MTSPQLPLSFTCAFKESSGRGIELDLYLPPVAQEPSNRLRPTLVYFHGGGLTVGDKTSWFPFWIYSLYTILILFSNLIGQDRAMAAGFAFISTNYRLIPPASGHQIIEDIKHLFIFLENGINNVASSHGRHDHIDIEKIGVIGTSAGGLCAHLAGIHANPKPKAALTMYGMGGDFFTPHYLTPKCIPFFRGRELLDRVTFSEYVFPHSRSLPSTASSQLSYYGSDHSIPGYPSNPRMLLARLYLQLGNFIDYYTGELQPSISDSLKDHLTSNTDGSLTDWPSLIPSHHQPLFPQLNVSSLPPTFFIHGSQDTAVPLHESCSLHRQLQSEGIVTVLKICDGMEHSFDYEPDAEQRWSVLFDEAFDFLKDRLLSA
ncbi:alpha/beta-hydrolase [Ramaria rubella]|nr:alpha/beta-hydrolase [Ramaria rubella]